MTIKRDGRNRLRNYKTEYDRDHASAKDRGDRAARNRARSKLKVKGGRNAEVHHKDGNPRNNARSNLKVISRKKNTTMSNKKRAKRKKK